MNESGQDTDKKRGVGLGVFDGCHRGHQELIRALISRTQEQNMLSCVYTFTHHPAIISGNKERISKGLLTTEEDKIELLRNTGVDEIFFQDFSPEFSRVMPEDFLDHYLLEELNVGLIVVGFNYHFGKDRLGDVAFLKKWAKTRNVEVIVMEPVLFHGSTISSSAIRKSIQKGEFETVNAMLGREYRLSGVVLPGQKIGTKLGFPTANVYPAEGLCLPENGVYTTRLQVGERTYESVTNIGLRPSVPGAVKKPIMETMVLDRNMDLYGQPVTVKFLHMLRKEMKFQTIEDLKTQVQHDIANAKRWHTETEQCWEMAKIGTVPIYGIRSERFTGDVINIVAKMPLSLTTASENSLLSRVLTATCQKFPSRPELSKYLDSLYGAAVDCHTEAAGDVHLIHFTADALHTWRGITFPFMDTVRLLFSMLFEPHFDSNHCFAKEIFEAEKQNLIMELKARENDKTKYAFDRCTDLLTEGTVQNAKGSGNAEVIAKITAEELTAAYHEMMKTANISIFAAGKLDPDIVDEICSLTGTVFQYNQSDYRLIPGKIPQYYKPKPSKEEHLDLKELEQARICLAYKGLLPYYSGFSGSLAVFNSMLGGDVHSLLFDVVREKMGLAYSVFSTPMRYLASVVLIAGVAPENVEIAKKAMMEQVDRLAQNEYDESVFRSAIEAVSYSYRSVSDDLHSMLFYYSNSLTAGRTISIPDALILLQDVTRETITAIARRLELSVVYTLTQKKEQNTRTE